MSYLNTIANLGLKGRRVVNRRRFVLEALPLNSLQTKYKLAKGLPLDVDVSYVDFDDMVEGILEAAYR